MLIHQRCAPPAASKCVPAGWSGPPPHCLSSVPVGRRASLSSLHHVLQQSGLGHRVVVGFGKGSFSSPPCGMFCCLQSYPHESVLERLHPAQIQFLDPVATMLLLTPVGSNKFSRLSNALSLPVCTNCFSDCRSTTLSVLGRLRNPSVGRVGGRSGGLTEGPSRHIPLPEAGQLPHHATRCYISLASHFHSSLNLQTFPVPLG